LPIPDQVELEPALPLEGDERLQGLIRRVQGEIVEPLEDIPVLDTDQAEQAVDQDPLDADAVEAAGLSVPGLFGANSVESQNPILSAVITAKRAMMVIPSKMVMMVRARAKQYMKCKAQKIWYKLVSIQEQPQIM